MGAGRGGGGGRWVERGEGGLRVGKLGSGRGKGAAADGGKSGGGGSRQVGGRAMATVMAGRSNSAAGQEHEFCTGVLGPVRTQDRAAGAQSLGWQGHRVCLAFIM